MRRHATTAFAMAFALAPPAAAAAQGSTWHLGPPCEPIQVLRAEREVVMVCPHRVTVLDAQTRAERWSRQSRDPIVRVVRDEGGELVAVTARRSRVPLGATDGPRSPSGRAGVVAASDRDRASVRLDPGAAAEVGQALAFFVERGGAEVRVATGTVEEIARGLAHVRLGLGERAPVGAEARPVRFVEHSVVAPPRIGDRVALRIGVDAFVPAGLGGGAMLTIDGAWHLDAPVVLRAGAPLALAASGNGLGGIFAGLGYASAGLELDWLELSLGAAVTTINQRSRGQATEAFAALLGVRLGSADGLSAEAQLFFTADDVGLELGAGRLRLTLPVSPRGARIVHRADIGRHGVLRVDGGPVFFLDGRGDRGSLALGLFGGFAHVFYERVCPFGLCARAIAVSPSFGVELDWRP